MRTQVLLVLAVVVILYVCAALTGCSTKRVVKDCTRINESQFFICKDQWEVWR